ncbi:TetR/AcrR family transcriptional regulator [Dietzia kunjamensis]|uniref:TetR/AcrR family transcriptional regulator n=1 Tax=Dietzia kunjamensis TaxID=322509 RepID=UPI0022B4BB46|nr:TetR/AcrR family transcriptional regulator [Dietzia kunjamensis]MCZ4655974.1 TetR/AcrR family transcriptional regulator [Dietzia kunjamensis]
MRSRDSILDATRAVVGRAGFGGVTIAAVAKQAEVSRQTVYSIFGSREDLVSQAVSERLTMLTGAFTDVLDAATTPLEVGVHVGWSVLCLDSPEARSDDDLRTFLTTWLAPLLETFGT